MNRRTIVAIAAAIALAAGVLTAASASAGDYPTWDDVERARSDERAAAEQVKRVEAVIAQLDAEADRKQVEADRAGEQYAVAQSEFEDAADRAHELQSQADLARGEAAEAAELAGRLAVQQYRLGGDDTALDLFFSTESGADRILEDLGTRERLTRISRTVHADASGARDNAQNLADQAELVGAERDRLRGLAEEKADAAQHAAAEARAAVTRKTDQRLVLDAQLAALHDRTQATVASYKAGVEERRRLAAEQEARERAEAEAAARAAAKAEGTAAGGEVNEAGWSRPAHGKVTSEFGPRSSICGGGRCTSSGHRGIDFAAGCSTPIYAAAAGKVIHAGYSGSWGNYVKVDHGGGIITGYAHIKPGGYEVSEGDHVKAGQVIAYVGSTGASTGCHLHFEVYEDGVRIDPAPVLKQHGIDV